MKRLINEQNQIPQKEAVLKSYKKNEFNTKRTSIIFFQIGLIMCLLVAYSLFEMKFETNSEVCAYPIIIDSSPRIDIPIITIENPVEKTPILKAKNIQSDDFLVAPDDKPDLPFDDKPDNITPDNTPSNLLNSSLNIGGLDVDPPSDDVSVHFIRVEKVPVYPGCEMAANNDERRKCMSEKISKLILRKFNTDIATDLGLSGIQKIQTQFEIDNTGHVTNIKVFNKYPQLEKEALRVINEIPNMIPGRQFDKNVGVIYSLPIIFQVQ